MPHDVGSFSLPIIFLELPIMFRTLFMLMLLVTPCVISGCDSGPTSEVKPLQDESVYEAEEARFESDNAGGGGV